MGDFSRRKRKVRKIKQAWFRRRWLDFRHGHNFYIAFMLAVTNFAIISYALALERLPVLKEMFPNMWNWVVFFVVIYIPTAIIIGYFHKRTQLPVEQSELALRNPVLLFQMRRLDDIAEAIEMICRRLDIKDIDIAKWKDYSKKELNSDNAFD